MNARRSIELLALIGGLLCSMAVSAATYYVDSVAGNDSNSGLSTAVPWRTLAKVQSTVPANSTVLLKRGSTWAEQLTVPVSNLTLDAYGTGSAPKLDSSVAVTGWTSLGSGIYESPALTLASILNGGGLGNLSEDGVLMSLVPWQGSASATLSSAPNGSYSYAVNAGYAAPHKLHIKVASNPATSGKVYRASTLLYGVRADGKSNVSVRNLHITRFGLLGIDYNNCTTCTVDYLTVTDGGGFAFLGYIYAGNGIQWSGNSSNGYAEYVTVSNIFDSGISPQTFAGNSNLHDITIGNSTIDKVGFAGVEISLLDFGTASTINNITIADVAITDTGYGWSGNRNGVLAHGIRIGDGPEAGNISNVTVLRTTVTNSLGNGMDIFGEVGTVNLYQVRLTENEKGIDIRDALKRGGQSGYWGSDTLKLAMTSSIIDSNRAEGIDYFDPLGTAAGLTLIHNTFYSNGSKNLRVRAQGGGAALVANNVFAGDTAMAQLHIDNTMSGVFLDYNCYSRSSGMINIALYGLTYNTLSSFISAFASTTGYEAHGFEGIPGGGNPTGLNLDDPDSGVAEGFELTTGSPCIGVAATGTGVTHDYFGQAYGGTPSMGAVAP